MGVPDLRPTAPAGMGLERVGCQRLAKRARARHWPLAALTRGGGGRHRPLAAVARRPRARGRSLAAQAGERWELRSGAAELGTRRPPRAALTALALAARGTAP